MAVECMHCGAELPPQKISASGLNLTVHYCEACDWLTISDFDGKPVQTPETQRIEWLEARLVEYERAARNYCEALDSLRKRYNTLREARDAECNNFAALLNEARAQTEKWRKEALTAHKNEREMWRLIRAAVRRAENAGLSYVEFDAMRDWLKRIDEEIPL